MWRRRVEQFLQKKKKGFLSRTLLALPSFSYKTLVQLKNTLYDEGVFKIKHSPLTVVSIGNLCAGGTGKTPLTYLLAKELLPHVKVAILSRGYKREGKKPLLVSFGKGPIVGPHSAGDEPYLLSKRLPEALLFVGKDRFELAKEAEKGGAEIIILDDGMQHRKIGKDIEIVVVDGEAPFACGHFLPLGLLREDPKRLKKANLIVMVGTGSKQTIETFTSAPIVTVEREKGEMVFEDAISPKKVGLFCGIGQPLRFFKTVKEMGLEIVSTHFLADHEKFQDKKLQEFEEEVLKKGGEALLCTEKDFVKLSKKRGRLPYGFVRSDFYIKENKEAWERLMNEIVAGVKR